MIYALFPTGTSDTVPFHLALAKLIVGDCEQIRQVELPVYGSDETLAP